MFTKFVQPTQQNVKTRIILLRFSSDKIKTVQIVSMIIRNEEVS